MPDIENPTDQPDGTPPPGGETPPPAAEEPTGEPKAKAGKKAGDKPEPTAKATPKATKKAADVVADQPAGDEPALDLPVNVPVDDLLVPPDAPPPTNATVVDVATKPAKRKPFVWVVTYAHDDGFEVTVEQDNLDAIKVKKGARALLMTGDRQLTGDRPMGA